MSRQADLAKFLSETSRFQAQLEQEARGKLEPYSLKESSKEQQEALRGLAGQYGFKNLRGFNKWMEKVELDYYDLIKIASPE